MGGLCLLSLRETGAINRQQERHDAGQSRDNPHQESGFECPVECVAFHIVIIEHVTPVYHGNCFVLLGLLFW